MFQGNYNPYSITRQSRFMGIKKINWSSLLTNTQKTLNIINQAIPIVYQVKPIISNAKTMFKVINAVKEDDEITNTSYSDTKEEKNTHEQVNKNYDNGPIFYI